jgi:hypothetical protein
LITKRATPPMVTLSANGCKLSRTIAQPKDRIIAFKKQLEEDVDSMELFVRNGLDEALLLEMSTTDHERALVKQAFLPKSAV